MARIPVLVALALLLFAAPAQAEWNRATSAHFDIYAEAGAEEVRARAEKLERLDAALRLIGGMPADRESRPLTIFFLRDVGDVERVYGHGAGAAMGFYSPRLGGSLAVAPVRTPSLAPGAMTSDNVLFHEYTHHFLLQNFAGAYPPWFVEGFAEFYATAAAEADGAMTIGAVPLFRAQALRAGENISAAELLTTGSLDLRSPTLVNFYARSWLLVHYLTFNEARVGQRARYIAAIERGASLRDAAREAFGDLTALDRELRRYANSRLSEARIAASALQTPAVTVSPMSEADVALIPLRIEHMRGVAPDRARAFAESLRRLAAAHPRDPQTLFLLAEAEAGAGNIEASERAADQLLALAPNYSRALLRKAKNLEARDPAGGGRAARPLIVRANRADPRDPLPLIAYYRSFVRTGETPPAAALDGLLLAVQLAPQSADARMVTAAALARAGHRDEAMRVLRPAAFAPHGGASAEAAQALLRSVEAPAPDLIAVADRILADRLD